VKHYKQKTPICTHTHTHCCPQKHTHTHTHIHTHSCCGGKFAFY